MCNECLDASQGSVPETTGKAKLVDCPLSSYLSLILHEISKDMMKKTVLEFYSDNEIFEAKDIIWNCYGEELLGKKQKGTSAGEKTIKEKEVDNIM